MVFEKGLSIFIENVWDPYMGLDEKMRILKRKMEVLISRWDDVMAEIKDAELHSSKKQKTEVDNWQRTVKNLEHDFKCLEQEVPQSSNLSRIGLSNRADKIHKEVEDLLEQGGFSEGVFLNVNDEKGQPMVTTKLKGQMFDQSLKDVLVSLSEVSSIGIYGMAGVGKTTFAMHIHNHLLKDSRFTGQVYWVTVSQDFSITKMQNDIAKTMHLDLSTEDDEKKKAAMLFQSLKRKKSFVIILDDVWTHFDVKKVGIPLEIGGGKLIITSRSVEVCNKIRCQRKIKVETLSSIESWELFLETLDHSGDLPTEIEEIAKKMTKKCDGLPLGLITMAASMRGVNDVFEWRDAFEEFMESCMQMENMNNEVFPILHCSYNRLRDPRLQKCFLYCCLFPEDAKINRDELIRLFIVEELLDKRHSRIAEFDQGHAILNKLERACLLESANCEEICVRMHDLVREMALQIVRDEFKWLVKAGAQLREVPRKREWLEDLDKVSLMNNNIIKISQPLPYVSPRLTTLLLRGNTLSQVVDTFFLRMTGLRVLDLSFTSIVTLPCSVANLESLSTLLLQDCHNLKFVPPLNKLKNLIELDLLGTSIEEVPQGLENLVKLRCLDMRKHKTSQINQSFKRPTVDILATLSNIQYLLIPFDVRVEALQEMRQIEVFHGKFVDVCSFNRFVKYRQSSGKPSFFTITLCLKNYTNHLIAYENDLYLKKVVLIYFVVTGHNLKMLWYDQPEKEEEEEGRDVTLLPLDIQELEIQSCEFRSLGNSLLDAFPSLIRSKDLRCIAIKKGNGIGFLMRLSNCSSMGERMMGDDGLTSTCCPFQYLESLEFGDLIEFSGLCKLELGEALPPIGAFSHLRSLDVTGCHKMKKLIPRWLLQYLRNLTCITAAFCNELEEIITDVEEDQVNQCSGWASSSSSTIPSNQCRSIKDDEVVLPKLQFLSSYGLPKLRSIYKGRMTCSSIQSIDITCCPKLKRLPFTLPLRDGQPSAPPFLQKIIITDVEQWESLEWDHPQYKSVLRPFAHFCLSQVKKETSR